MSVLTEIEKKYEELNAYDFDVEAIAISHDKWFELAVEIAFSHPITEKDQDPVEEIKRKIQKRELFHLYWNGYPVIKGASSDIAIIVKGLAESKSIENENQSSYQD